MSCTGKSIAGNTAVIGIFIIGFSKTCQTHYNISGLILSLVISFDLGHLEVMVAIHCNCSYYITNIGRLAAHISNIYTKAFHFIKKLLCAGYYSFKHFSRYHIFVSINRRGKK